MSEIGTTRTCRPLYEMSACAVNDISSSDQQVAFALGTHCALHPRACIVAEPVSMGVMAMDVLDCRNEPQAAGSDVQFTGEKR
jgi:hypothetical protein